MAGDTRSRSNRFIRRRFRQPARTGERKKRRDWRGDMQYLGMACKLRLDGAGKMGVLFTRSQAPKQPSNECQCRCSVGVTEEQTVDASGRNWGGSLVPPLLGLSSWRRW
jgi:hypothetical protein